MSILIKLLSVFICTIYIYRTITKHSIHLSISKAKYICIIICLTSLAFLLHKTHNEFTYIIPLFLFWIFISLLTSHPQQCFIGCIISFTISFSQHILISLILTCIIYPFFPYNLVTFPFTFLALLSSLFQIFGNCLLCKSKRLKKGIPPISNQNFINIATIICILWSYIFIVIASDYHHSINRLIWVFICILSLAFLIYWWQAQITKSYRRTLELRELESMRTEMAELKLKMQEVMEENEKLSRITHRDNTLISTLKNSTVKYLMTDFTNSAVAIATGEKLIANINALSAGRTSLPDNFNEKKARTFDTGVPLLDELLHQMDITAIENEITFSVHMGTILSDFVPAHVSSDDLVHTVDDLLKNAFKATNTCDKRVVQLQFYKLSKHFVIEVADSGIPFEVRSLVNMGIERLTTYDDGSGIGLVDIWNTKTKYGATYHIDEYAVATPFSKKISLTFDKKNRYSIRTWRKNEITQMSKRADLQVYEDSE